MKRKFSKRIISIITLFSLIIGILFVFSDEVSAKSSGSFGGSKGGGFKSYGSSSSSYSSNKKIFNSSNSTNSYNKNKSYFDSSNNYSSSSSNKRRYRKDDYDYSRSSSNSDYSMDIASFLTGYGLSKYLNSNNKINENVIPNVDDIKIEYNENSPEEVKREIKGFLWSVGDGLIRIKSGEYDASKKTINLFKDKKEDVKINGKSILEDNYLYTEILINLGGDTFNIKLHDKTKVIEKKGRGIIEEEDKKDFIDGKIEFETHDGFKFKAEGNNLEGIEGIRLVSYKKLDRESSKEIKGFNREEGGEIHEINKKFKKITETVGDIDGKEELKIFQKYDIKNISYNRPFSEVIIKKSGKVYRIIIGKKREEENVTFEESSKGLDSGFTDSLRFKSLQGALSILISIITMLVLFLIYRSGNKK